MNTSVPSPARNSAKRQASPEPWEDLVIHPQPAAEDPVSQPSAPTTMAAYMTHELRAPLTSIHSALALLQEKLEDKLDVHTDHILRLALKNTDRLAGLINDIMDYSQTQAGKISLKTRPVAPRELIQEATDTLRSWAVSKGVKLLRIPEEEPLPRVSADSKRTVQILVNLISNAIKFTPAGGRIEAYAWPGRLDHKGTIVFSIRDTGPGVGPEDRRRIFRCFEQAAAGTKTSQGTGLGLALSKAMVELQGGKIWVESWMGLGATFRFTVPIASEDLTKRIVSYPKPVQFHGILLPLFRRLNSIAAFFSF